MKNILCTALGSFSTKTVIEGLEKKGYTVYGADCLSQRVDSHGEKGKGLLPKSPWYGRKRIIWTASFPYVRSGSFPPFFR